MSKVEGNAVKNRNRAHMPFFLSLLQILLFSNGHYQMTCERLV